MQYGMHYELDHLIIIITETKNSEKKTSSSHQDRVLNNMDEDIDVIAENAVSAIKHAELYAHPDAFRQLHERLLSAGQSSDRVLMRKSSTVVASTSTTTTASAASISGAGKKEISLKC